jgi:hypothetical protein
MATHGPEPKRRATFTMTTTWLRPDQEITARGSPKKLHLYSMRLRPLALLLLLTAFASPADAQRRKRPQNDRQTPKTVSESIRSAEEKEAARTLELQTGWDGAKDAHFTKQDRATRRRMKRTAKKSQRYRSGRSVPWWKRIVGTRNRLR